jgi:asparagine N-glycosylation enzyme membrane subunit Stt3
MNKDNLPFILIIASVILIILNFIFTSDEMDIGFWMRILSSGLLILAMYITIRNKKNERGK